VTRLLAGRSRIQIPVGVRFFSSEKSRPNVEPTHPLIHCALGPVWPECEADHSSASDAELKNWCNYTSAPPVCVQDVDREHFSFFTFNFTFTFALTFTRRTFPSFLCRHFPSLCAAISS